MIYCGQDSYGIHLCLIQAHKLIVLSVFNFFAMHTKTDLHALTCTHSMHTLTCIRVLCLYSTIIDFRRNSENKFDFDDHKETEF